MLDSKLLFNEYVTNKLSTRQIGEKYNEHPNQIRRWLLKANIQLRTKSVAQKNAIKVGTHPHPTKGRKRTEETKTKISQSLKNREKEQ